MRHRPILDGLIGAALNTLGALLLCAVIFVPVLLGTNP